MPQRDPRVDAYIAAAAPFAQPILRKIRAAWHKADRDIEETIKWRVPYFRKHGLLGCMAAFKGHVSLGFWRAKDLSDSHGLVRDGSMLSAIRFASVRDLPAEKVLIAYMREAIALDEDAGRSPGSRKRKPVKVPAVPADLRQALARKRGAIEAFRKLAPSHRKEYIEWITGAKQAATRERRVAQAAEWIAEGKTRHWKYEQKGR
jgi:uncharacterized protein YdeI (YjbR/CyaY-like superfamily)